MAEHEPMPWDKCVTLSISHISREDEKALDKMSSPNKLFPLSVAKHRYGYYIVIDTELMTDDLPESLSDAFWVLYQRCLDEDIAYLNLDADGPVWDLPLYDW